MSKALYGFAVASHKLSSFRKKCAPLRGEDLEDTELARMDLYIDAQRAYLYLESEEGAALAALQKGEKGKAYANRLQEQSYFKMMKVKQMGFEELGAWGDVPADGEVQLLKAVAEHGAGEGLKATLAGLPEDVHDQLGVTGFEAWWHDDDEMVLRVAASDLDWLTTAADALDGATLYNVLYGLTDLNPRDRGRTLLRGVGEDPRPNLVLEA